jgi:hypothetical protein
LQFTVFVFLLETSTGKPLNHWAVVALGVLTILYVAVIRPMRKGKRKDPLETMSQPGRQATTLAQQRAIERDMAAVLVEYEEMIRRMTAQLDTRATKLQLLMDEADAKLLQLKEASRGLKGPGERQAGVASDTTESETAAAARAGAEPRQISSGRPENGEADSDAADAGGAYADVYHLADRGQSPRQIAQELNRPDGEIELILALRQSRS